MNYWVNQYVVAPDAPGGTRHFEFALRLNQKGITVELVAADLNLSTRSYTRRFSSRKRQNITEEVEGVKIHWLYTTLYSRNNWRRAYSMFRFAWSVFWFLMRVPIDESSVFIGSSPHLLAALATQLAARMRGTRLIFEVRDLWPETLIGMTGKNGLAAKILRLIADYLYNRSEKIIVLASQSQEVIAARGVPKQKIIFVPNSVDPDLFQEKNVEGFAFPGTLKEDDFIAVYAGAHGSANNLDLILDAAAFLQEQGYHRVKFLLVGDGPCKGELVERIKREDIDNVVFLDPVRKVQIPALFKRCDVGLLVLRDVPVFRYGISPNKLFDYMASGLPVVTNVQGEVASVIAEANCGLVVSPEDTAGFAKRVAELSSDPGRCRQLGEAGRKYVFENYNRAILVDRLVEVF
ncbi:MAG: glycosyltransferase family 4 protein [Firmicutes bacterium]|nr:glycosyltransferase family 4 protein [Bacillota bacterium]